MTGKENMDSQVLTNLFHTLYRLGLCEAQFIESKSEGNTLCDVVPEYKDRWWSGYSIKLFVTPLKRYIK